ncbi:MAG: AIPR family protein [Bryobacterales bacterium]|nr:AIPR family protein [Bryobacterales bacterium]
MARNDVVFVDSLVKKASSSLGDNRSESEIFELFCFDNVLKDCELSYEELESGWTDGTDDGGVDGFFLFVDGNLTSDTPPESASRRSPEIRVALFTVNRSDSFNQQPLNALCSSIQELFDLTREESELRYPFRQEVLVQRELFRSVFISLADRRPRLVVSIYYCCRGDTSTLAGNLTSRAGQLEETIRSLFGEVASEVRFLGATELLEMARRQRTYSLRLRFIESYISREGRNYVVLVPLRSYFEFVTDEQGKLRRYLFDSNVRDYLGKVQINRDIQGTLERNTVAEEEDFWWLNNGVTILATHATVIGKELTIENVQIVNGLQTTETIYQHFSLRGQNSDDRAILIKILLTTDETARARIVKATNYQNTVDLSSLRGLDKIQQDIEHFFLDHGWYYDRRKNFYKNQGRPADRIVSMPYLAAAVRAVALGDPAASPRQRSSSLRDDKVYRQVFNKKWDLGVYLASLEITQAIEAVIQHRRTFTNTPPIALVHFVAYVYACSKLGKHSYRPDEIAAIAGCPPGPEEVLRIRDALSSASDSPELEGGRFYEGVHLSKNLISEFVRSRYGQKRWLDVTIHGEAATPVAAELSDVPVEITALLTSAKSAGTITSRIEAVYQVLRQVAEVVGTAVGGIRNAKGQVFFKRSIVAAARKRGLADARLDSDLFFVVMLRGRIRNGYEPTVRDGEGYLNAAERIIQKVGLGAHRESALESTASEGTGPGEGVPTV